VAEIIDEREEIGVEVDEARDIVSVDILIFYKSND
jgi:hypothetical protein